MNKLETLTTHGRAYAHLEKGANILLERNIFWTECLFLRLVRALYTKRLRELVLVLPEEEVEELLRE